MLTNVIAVPLESVVIQLLSSVSSSSSLPSPLYAMIAISRGDELIIVCSVCT